MYVYMLVHAYLRWKGFKCVCGVNDDEKRKFEQGDLHRRLEHDNNAHSWVEPPLEA